MRNSLLLLCFLGFTVSCADRESNLKPLQKEILPVLKDGYLSFDDPNALNWFLNQTDSEKLELADKWEAVDGFTSLNECYNQHKTGSDALGIIITKEIYENKVRSDVAMNISIPILAKLVNAKGIVKVGKSLMFFSSEYTKVLAGFKGTQSEIEMIQRETTSIPTKKLYVKPVVRESLENLKANNKARVSSNFNYYAKGNDVVVFKPNTYPPQYKIGYVKCYVEGVHTEVPNAWCWDETEPAMPVQYPCGWIIYYQVTTRAEFYLDGNGTTQAGISINWNTDRGSGSATNQATICYTSAQSGQQVLAYGSIEGSVSFDLLITQPPYNSQHSTAMISL